MQTRNIPLLIGSIVVAVLAGQTGPRGFQSAVVTPPAAPPAVRTAPDPKTGPPVLLSTVPADLPGNPTQEAAVTFAWQSFVAVNWPVQALSRGTPDETRRIGEPGDVVWHTWKTPDEVFYPDGQRPPDWNQYGGSPPPECVGAAAGDFVMRRISKVPGDAKNAAIDLAREVVGGTLTDQHGRLARYEIRMNETIFDEIVAKQYYNVEGQDKAPFISLPAGVMEVKAAWREMTADDTPQVQGRFFRRNAWIYTPPFGQKPAACTKGEVGLVGLHVTHKTASRAQWTWATFEQVDNVPPFTAAAAAVRSLPYSFNDPTCPVSQCPPNQSTEKNGLPTSTPTQVTRTIAIGPAAQQANRRWRAALAQAVPGSPFQFYQLVDIQWPQTPGRRPFGNPTPGLLANTTMETYVAESSCLHCHYTARTASGNLSSDYTFMLAEAQSAGKAAR